MQADWIWGLVGGAMIGTAAAAYLLLNGRIMGASGIIGRLADGSEQRASRSSALENLAFLLGLALVPGLLWLVIGRPATNLTSQPVILIAAGLMVGAGTRLANGCTSGHGVCGLSRLSFRGFVATVFYLVGGGLSVIFFRHLLGIS
ncbi:YeeE/YedE family protein [Albidovulum sediminicola]|uniref:YeeE/YedE thiosulfate transporter family protein n=1 Tax=Albidovulum sediminicola TaxID=2984331 RepID=A0ABT2Z2D4_9RHOB|nr:YeeE/YedE thiosulfate transporter family protein [Defluviimonas sp. WL0075]MCV2865248.1 YeeE/YedE thiosulfate transporter family protein [Defluviimonas sp. WL0075]